MQNCLMLNRVVRKVTGRLRTLKDGINKQQCSIYFNCYCIVEINRENLFLYHILGSHILARQDNIFFLFERPRNSF